MSIHYRPENVQIVAREGFKEIEVFDADELLFSFADSADPIAAGLAGYNAGVKHGATRGRAYLQFELRRLLGAEPERSEP